MTKILIVTYKATLSNLVPIEQPFSHYIPAVLAFLQVLKRTLPLINRGPCVALAQPGTLPLYYLFNYWFFSEIRTIITPSCPFTMEFNIYVCDSFINIYLLEDRMCLILLHFACLAPTRMSKHNRHSGYLLKTWMHAKN